MLTPIYLSLYGGAARTRFPYPWPVYAAFWRLLRYVGAEYTVRDPVGLKRSR